MRGGRFVRSAGSAHSAPLSLVHTAKFHHNCVLCTKSLPLRARKASWVRCASSQLAI